MQIDWDIAARSWRGMRSHLRSGEIAWATLRALTFRVAGSVVALGMSCLVAQRLGAAQAGYFFLALTVVTVVAAVSRCGLDAVVLRTVAAGCGVGQWGEARSAFSRSVRVIACMSSALALLLFLSSEFVADSIFGKPPLARTLVLMCPGVVFLSLSIVTSHALQGLRRIASSVFVLNIGVHFSLCTLLLLCQPAEAYQVAGYYTVAAMINLAIALSLWRQAIRPGEGEVRLRDMLASGAPLWLVVMMDELIRWSGQFVAGALVAPTELAQLAAALRLSMLMSFSLMAANQVCAPRFAEYWRKGDLAAMQRTAQMAARFMMLLAIPLCAVMMIVPEWLMRLFGEEFTAGAPLLRILALGQLVNVATGSVAFLLTMSGHERDMRNTTIVSGAAAIMLALVLTPIWGATGAAIATAIATALTNLLRVRKVQQRLGFNTIGLLVPGGR